MQTYQNQMRKMMTFVLETYIPMIPEKAIASKTRLYLFLQETFVKTGTLPDHKGNKISP